MKTYRFIAVFLLLANAGSASEVSDPNCLLSEMNREIAGVTNHYDELLDVQFKTLNQIDRSMLTTLNNCDKVDLLLRKDRVLTEIRILRNDSINEISKIRYLKGLQIIKILYEKVLSLDHHFASVRTFSEINKISNPNQYPEYSKLKEVLAANRERRTAFELTTVLGTNTIVSAIQTFTAMLSSNLTKQEKERELATVECILDFTLRMQNDLNTIYFDTAFLQTSNDKIKEEIESLFRDYTKAIGYSATLESCRINDDWETLIQKMDEYLRKMKGATASSQYKMQVNMEFPVDRLLQFITQYNNHIDQGGKFYEKFKIILNSYENEKQCESKLPPEYTKLKADMDVAINKFNVAYKPVEVNGSKMKEILYGLNEFE